MNSELFNLTWNDFSSCTQETFRSLLNEDEFMDVTLVCDDQEQLKAHKVILSACSPFFKNILKKNAHPNPLIFLSGVDVENLKAILNFIYLGETAVGQNHLDSFMLACKVLKIKGLTEPEEFPKRKEMNERPPEPNKKYIQNQNLPTPKIKSEVFNEFQAEHQKIIANVDLPESDQSYFMSPNLGGTFSCAKCDYQLNSKSSLKRHDEMKHQGIRYPCDKCDFKASTKDNLKRHILGKHEGATFSCNDCEFKATQKGNLRRHKISVHGLPTFV